MTCLHAKFHMPRCNCSLIIAVELSAKESVCTSAMLLFHILQRKVPLKNVYIFEDLL
jgi:hypothetical protein